MSDRYLLNDYAIQSAEFSKLTENLDRPLGHLLRDSEFGFVISGDMKPPVYSAIPIHVHLENSTTSNVGRTLLDLDVELRRCATYMLDGSIRPLRNFTSVELISAVRTYSVDIVIAVARQLYDLLITRPVTFLQLLDWFWSLRLSQTKVRQPHVEVNRAEPWNDIVSLATSCIEHGRSVVLTVDVTSEGTTRFGFESL
jgi:hypothetical protein